MVNAVHVWLVDVDDEAVAVQALRLLPDGERSRLGLRAQPHHRRGVCAHAALRVVLAGGTRPLPDLTTVPGGKPVLLHGGQHLSLSHSGRLAAIAITTAGIVGVDIERRAPIPEREGMARTILSGPEQREWRASGASEETLLQAWTRKEAVLKALGTGLAGGMRSVTTRLRTGELTMLPDGAGPVAGWTLVDLAGPGDYLGAVAVRAKDVATVVHVATIGELLAEEVA